MLEFLKKLFGGGQDIKAILEKGAAVIDVRTPAEFKSGHAKGAVNIPLDQIDKNLKRIKQMNKPVVTCCVSGRRSGLAAKRLNELGVEAYNGGPWQRVKGLQG